MMILQAIETRYLSPANVRGARVKATASAGSVTLGWDHALNPDENHAAAARALCARFDWKGTLATGCLATGHRVHVFTGRED